MWWTSIFTIKGSNNSAVDWAILSKIGVQIELNIAKQVQTLKPKPEVDFQLYGSDLEQVA